MATPESDDAQPSTLGEIDRLIHEPARLSILVLLYVIESADFTFLMNQTGLTWGNLSSHVNKLERAGYVAIEKKFVGKRPQTLAHLTEAGRAAFQVYRRQMQQVFDDLPD